MTIDKISLRKFLQLLGLPEAKRISEFRIIARRDKKRQEGVTDDTGPDFYSGFWSDAKSHVYGLSDLRDTTPVRIAANDGRARLYPMLQDGFLTWWDERRRWQNAPFQKIPSIKGQVDIGTGAIIRLDNILSVKDSQGVDHHVYPYWCETPVIDEELATIAIQVLLKAFPEQDPNEIRILDTIRGVTYSVDRVDLGLVTWDDVKGRHRRLKSEYQKIRKTYD